MKKEDCYQLGQVIKTHGLKGKLSVLLDVDDPIAYKELESVFVEQQGQMLIPFFIDSLQINGKMALVGFEDITSIEQAQPLVGIKLYLPDSFLPKLQKDQYYYHDLVNCQVLENDTPIGIVKEVIDLHGNKLLSVLQGEKEILIPLKDEILVKVEVTKKQIEVALPDGLLDLYL